MPRVFASLAAANLILYVGAAALGLLDPPPTTERHILLSVLALLLTCLIQVLTFTYLAVSGKVIAQALHIRKMDVKTLVAAAEIKKRFARYVALMILALVGATATGASAWRAGNADGYHFPAALTLFAVFIWVHARQYTLVIQNSRLMDGALADCSVVRGAVSESSEPARASGPSAARESSTG